MKLLFAHNIRIKEDENGNLYTHSSYNSKVWKRYESISDELTVISRKEKTIYSEEDAHNKFEPFDNEKMSIAYVKDQHESIKTFLNPSIHIYNSEVIKQVVNESDYIIARLPSASGFKAIEYAKKNNKPYLCEVVACSWDGLWNHSFKGKIMAPFSFLKLKKTVKHAPYVVYVTNTFLQKRYPTNGLHTNCSNVSLKHSDPIVLENRLNKIKNMKKSDKIVIGTTAAVDVKYKGQQYVIEALGELKRKGILNYEYHLVGGGNPEYLKSVAEKNNVIDQIKFLGPLPHHKVFDWLEEIDIYAQPSKQEGLPRGLIEAMNKAVPSIGARTAGIPELLDPNYVFEKGNKNVKQILEILSGLDQEAMINQAKRNFEEAKLYEESIIDNRRKAFFEIFLSFKKTI